MSSFPRSTQGATPSDVIARSAVRALTSAALAAASLCGVTPLAARADAAVLADPVKSAPPALAPGVLPMTGEVIELTPSDMATFAINDAGDAVGVTYDGSSESVIVRRRDGAVEPIEAPTTAYPRAINNGRVIAGRHLLGPQGSGPAHGFRADAAEWEDLLPLGGANAFVDAINDRGDVVGRAETAAGTPHAAIWPAGSTTPVDLGALAPDPTLDSAATDINERGEVVGWVRGGDGRRDAFRWSEDSGLTLLEPDTRDNLARSINDHGVVAVQLLEASGVGHGHLWTPAGIDDLDDVGCHGSPVSVNDAGWVGLAHGVVCFPGAGGLHVADMVRPITIVGHDSNGLTHINDAGEVHVTWASRFGSAVLYESYLWAPRAASAVVVPSSRVHELPTGAHGGRALATNASGETVGWIAGADGHHAVRWWRDQFGFHLVDLAAAVGAESEAQDLNDAGTIVGIAAPGAFAWDESGGLRWFRVPLGMVAHQVRIDEQGIVAVSSIPRLADPTDVHATADAHTDVFTPDGAVIVSRPHSIVADALDGTILVNEDAYRTGLTSPGLLDLDEPLPLPRARGIGQPSMTGNALNRHRHMVATLGTPAPIGGLDVDLTRSAYATDSQMLAASKMPSPIATSINDSGGITGRYGKDAAIWSPAFGIEVLGHLAGDASSHPAAINQDGVVVGWSTSSAAAGGAALDRPVLWGELPALASAAPVTAVIATPVFAG